MIHWVFQYLCVKCSVFRVIPGACQVCGGPTQLIDI